MRPLLLLVLCSTPAVAAPRDCALGFLAWCVVDAEARPDRPTRLRLELFAGYKPAIGYFEREQRACAAASPGCQVQLDGATAALDVFVHLGGRARSEDSFDVGLSYVALPVARLAQNARGFEGELGPVAAGDGELSWAAVRLSLRRASLLYLVKSKYLISSFGVGLAFPLASGAGRSFPGGDGPRFTLGGRLGAQLPLTDDFAVGLATSYGVVWYGPRFEHAAYVGGYGLNLQWLL